MLADSTDVVAVVRGLHGAVIPLRVFVHRREEIHFDHNALLVGLGDEIPETTKVIGVPAGQVKAVATVDVAWRIAPRPWANQLAWIRGQGVALDLERSDWLHVTARKGAGEIQPIGR